MFRILAKINKALLPSYTRRGLELANANRWQQLLLAWRYYVTSRALSEK